MYVVVSVLVYDQRPRGGDDGGSDSATVASLFAWAAATVPYELYALLPT